jgi:hypothetical protein
MAFPAISKIKGGVNLFIRSLDLVKLFFFTRTFSGFEPVTQKFETMPLPQAILNVYLVRDLNQTRVRQFSPPTL